MRLLYLFLFKAFELDAEIRRSMMTLNMVSCILFLFTVVGLMLCFLDG